jgi:hypothetical protein
MAGRFCFGGQSRRAAPESTRGLALRSYRLGGPAALQSRRTRRLGSSQRSHINIERQHDGLKFSSNAQACANRRHLDRLRDFDVGPFGGYPAPNLTERQPVPSNARH